jgi:hypothetical protein
LRTLSLTEPQARERLAAFFRAEHGTNSSDAFHADHFVIERDNFVFSIPRPDDLSLVNYAVDGHTGKVTRLGRNYVPDGNRFILQKIPIKIEAGKPIQLELRPTGGGNQVGLRCMPEARTFLTNGPNSIKVRLLSPNKEGTFLYHIDPHRGSGLWPIEAFYYLFQLYGKSKSSVEITFTKAPPGVTPTQIIVLKHPADFGP